MLLPLFFTEKDTYVAQNLTPSLLKNNVLLEDRSNKVAHDDISVQKKMNDDDIIKASKTIGTIAGSLFGVLLTLGITLGIFIVLALIFPINPDKVQGWFSAWIQGVFWLPNWIISWFKDPWYIRAPLRCKSYSFWFWFGVVCNVWGNIKVILSLISNIRRKKAELHKLCNR